MVWGRGGKSARRGGDGGCWSECAFIVRCFCGINCLQGLNENNDFCNYGLSRQVFKWLSYLMIDYIWPKKIARKEVLMSSGIQQEIAIHTENEDILRLFFSEQRIGYRVFGNYYDNETGKLEPLTFRDEIVHNCIEALGNCLKELECSLRNKNDKIVRVRNPCNTPFITAPQQLVILKDLNIFASVEVN